MKKTSRWIALFALLSLVSGVFLVGCDLFDDDDDGVVTPQPPAVSGLEFTSEELTDVADIGADTVDLLSKMGLIFGGIIGNLPAPELPNGVLTASPLATVPLGESGVCQFGAETDNVVWNDNDDSGTPSAGDTVEVFWADCGVEPGTLLYGSPIEDPTANPAVTFTFTDNVPLTPPFVVQGTMELNIVVSEFGCSTNLSGTMPANATTPDFTAVTISLGNVLGTSANTEIVLDPEPECEDVTVSFGCFDVIMEFADISNPLDFSISARGVEKASFPAPIGAKVLQIGDYAEGETPGTLDFLAGIPNAGSVKLLSFDSRPSFELLSCYGVVTGTTSALVRATGGGSGEVDLFTDVTLPDPWAGDPAETQTYTGWLEVL